MNRRSFFGMAAGAAASGPSLAKMAAESNAVNVSSYGQIESVKSGLNVFDKARRIIELQDIVAGKVPRQPRTKSEYDLTGARCSIDTLRSVSLQHKYEMLQAVQAERQHQSWLEYSKKELASLLGLA